MKTRTPATYFSILIITIGAHADILDNWHWRNPTPFAHTMRSVCFGGGRFVAVGDGGVIHTSTDGTNWDDGRRPITSQLNRVIHVNGQFVAVGSNGTIVTSADGFTWSPRSSGTTNHLFGVAFANGKLIACGAAGQLAVSTDGISWTAASVGSDDLNFITAGNGVFVLQAPAISQWQLAVRVSNDGLNWATTPFPGGTPQAWPSSLLEAEFANGMFLASAYGEQGNFGVTPALDFYTSLDGTNWTKHATGLMWPGGHRFLAGANGSFHEFVSYLPGSRPYGGQMVTSPNGTSVFVLPTAEETWDATDLSHGNGRYVLLANSGKLWTSAAATNWVAAYGGFRTTIFQIIRGANNYVAVGNSMPILISSDGINFSPAPNTPSETYGAVGFDGSNYVVVGNSGLLRNSTNALDWVLRTSNTGQNLAGICRGPNHWVAVGGNGAIITSPTTLAWTLRSSGTANHLRSVAFGNGYYVAVGDGGTIITSPDAANWDVQFSETIANLLRVAFLNGQFVAVGASGTILTSSDTINWQPRTSGISASLAGIAYGDGRYLAVGGAILQSTNAFDWQDISTKLPVGVALNSAAYLDQNFWVTGEGGVLLQSDSVDGRPRLAGTRLVGNAGFQLKVTLNAPSNYRFQTRTSAAVGLWEDLAAVTNSVSPHVWVHTNSTSDPLRLYRLISP